MSIFDPITMLNTPPYDYSGVIDEEVVDNTTSLMRTFASFYLDTHLSDICLVVGGVEYPSHRFILCASSEVFQAMLMNPQWCESQNDRVVLQEPPACCQIFGKFLKYFYTGCISITSASLTPLLTLADKYNIKELVLTCRRYMLNRIPYAAITNQLMSWLQYTFTYNHHDVTKSCIEFIKWNLELVSKCRDFGNIDADILAKILEQDDIVVYDEMTLFNYVVDWLQEQKNHLFGELCNENDAELRPTKEAIEQQLKEITSYVMVHIRFPMMSPHQLAGLLISPTVQAYKDFFIERMAIGMSYHSGHTDRLEEVCRDDEAGLKLFFPRLYTAENLSLLLPIEHFRDLPAFYSRTHVFSAHSSLADYKGDNSCEWVVDIYPKGVWFKKFYRIDWGGKEEIPEVVLRTVRLSITCKEPPKDLSLRVKIGVLIRSHINGVEHVSMVIERIHHFDDQDEVLNLDDIVPFEALNCSGTSPPYVTPFLVGPSRDVFKVHIVIAPLDKICNRSYYKSSSY